MPVLILSIPKYLDKLLEDSCLAAIAPLGEPCRIVVMAENVALMFVVAVLGAKDGGTDGAGEVLDVVFPVQGGDVGSSQSTSAGVTQEIQTAEVVCLAERVLIRRLVGDGEEF